MIHYQNLTLENLTEIVDGELKTEIWKEVDGYERHYQISTFGRFKSMARVTPQKHVFVDKIIRQALDTDGYPQVQVCKNGKVVHKKVHRLVAVAFIPNPENKPTVNHKKGIKQDNRVWELEWATMSENTKHAIDFGLLIPSGLGKLGSLNKKSKKVFQYSLDGALINTFIGGREAGRVTGIDRCSISQCCRGVGYYKTAGGYIWSYTEIIK